MPSKVRQKKHGKILGPQNQGSRGRAPGSPWIRACTELGWKNGSLQKLSGPQISDAVFHPGKVMCFWLARWVLVQDLWLDLKIKTGNSDCKRSHLQFTTKKARKWTLPFDNLNSICWSLWLKLIVVYIQDGKEEKETIEAMVLVSFEKLKRCIILKLDLESRSVFDDDGRKANISNIIRKCIQRKPHVCESTNGYRICQGCGLTSAIK